MARAGAPLSERQNEILRLIAQGKSNKEIAHQLGLTTGTVKQHVYALFRKLGVRNRTMAVVRGTLFLHGAAQPQDAPGGEAERTEVPAQVSVPEELRYARRLVTAVVVEPRPAPIRTSRDAAEIERRIVVLRTWIERLAFAFDARPELLAGGGIAAWFGQPVAHGDDAERAVAFVRALSRGAGAQSGIDCAAGIGTVAEVVGEGERSSVAYRTFRVATLLASLAEPDAPLACGLTSELTGLPPAAAGNTGADASRQLPAGAVTVGAQPPPSLTVARRWGGLPFIPEVVANVQRGRSQWLGVESWPPEAGTRLIDAIGECLAARRFSVSSLWMPAPTSGLVVQRLIGQLRGAPVPRDGTPVPGILPDALAALAARGPAVLLAYGIDALPTLKATLGERALVRLRALPLAIVAGAMHRSGAPQTVVRLLGPYPGASPFVRVLRMQVPEGRSRPPQGIRPDVQAVLDAVSAEARAIARLASNPRSCDVAAVAQALGMAPEAVIERCRELETSGLLSVNAGRLEFRDETTAAAVRASLA